MSTQDEIDGLVTRLTALAAADPQLTILQGQRKTLLDQLSAIDQQIAALQTPDGDVANQVLQTLRNVLPNRTGGRIVVKTGN